MTFFLILCCFIFAPASEANNRPIIEGGCGSLIEVEPNEIGTVFLEIYDPDPLDSIKNISTSVSPQPDGDYTLNGNFLTFYPTTNDINKQFVFCIRAYDNYDAMAYCHITFRCYKICEIGPIGVKIEYENNREGEDSIDGIGVMLGQHAYVDVVLDQSTEPVVGYDFLIAYDNTTLTAYGAYSNPEIYGIPGIYEWEYFTYKFIYHCVGKCPSGLLQIVSIAEQNDGAHHPSIDPNTGQIKRFPENTVLFTFDFLVSNEYTLECSFIPISFFWRDCGDNTIAILHKSGSPNETKIAISKDVFGFIGFYFPVTDLYSTLPTYLGAPEECMNEFSGNLPLRLIDFKNGGIKTACAEWDCAGDINLDGNYAGTEDVATFADYLVNGREAFTVNFDGQKAATDVNADGVPSTVADFVYLLRLFTFNAIPIGNILPVYVDKLKILEYSDSLIVESSFDISLGAVLLKFTNISQLCDISLDYSLSDMEINTGISGDTLSVLIYGFEKDKMIAEGMNRILKLSFSDNIPILISSDVTGYYGESLKFTSLTIQVPDQLSLSQNYPNPFNTSTIIEFALNMSGNWSIDIFNISGQRVKTIHGVDRAGPVRISWDGTDNNNRLLSSGVYFYRLKSGNQSKTKKMLLLK